MTIKIEKLKEEKKKGKMSFLVKGSSEAFVNTIRRLVLEEVPTLAVEDVEIKDNNSALYDEMLGLRLGLIPIKTDLKSYNYKQTCKCGGEGCAQCELKMHLASSKKGYVLAGEATSTDPKCTFVQENMIVVKLLAKQKLDVTMIAVLGNGRMHAKWSPGWAFYKREPKLTIGKVKDAAALAKKSADGVLSIKSDKLTVNEDQLYSSNLLEFYAELDEGIKLDYTDNLVFNLESWGQLSCKEMLNQSTDILINKTEELAKLI